MALRWEPVHRIVQGSDPDAGAEIQIVVPEDKWWILRSVTVSLSQGITQTPRPVLRVSDGTDQVFESFSGTGNQAVSTTCRHTWAEGIPLQGPTGTGTNVHSTGTLPANLMLGPGFVIDTMTLGIGANTNYAAPLVVVEEYDDYPAHLF